MSARFWDCPKISRDALLVLLPIGIFLVAIDQEDEMLNHPVAGSENSFPSWFAFAEDELHQTKIGSPRNAHLVFIWKFCFSTRPEASSTLPLQRSLIASRAPTIA
jgi:hypothetical protein